VADRYLLESGSPDGYLLEDGSGVLLLDGNVGVNRTDSSASLIALAALAFFSEGQEHYCVPVQTSADQAYAAASQPQVNRTQATRVYWQEEQEEFAYVRLPGRQVSVQSPTKHGLRPIVRPWFEESEFVGVVPVQDALVRQAIEPPVVAIPQRALATTRIPYAEPEEFFYVARAYLAPHTAGGLVRSTLSTFIADDWGEEEFTWPVAKPLRIAAAIGSGAISGSASVTFGASGTLSATGALSGSGSISFGQSGALTGSGLLSGSSSISFSQAGTLAGSAALSGTAQLSFAGSATADAPPGSISGSSAISFSGSGTLTGLGSMVGSGSITFNGSAYVPVSDAGGGYDLYYLAHDYAKRRKAQIERQKEEEEAEEALKDSIDREIARLMHEAERREVESRELSRLKELVRKYEEQSVIEGENQRIKSALEAAQAGTFSVFDRLQREIERMFEEEEYAVLLLLLDD
jgi:hypothetical protein